MVYRKNVAKRKYRPRRKVFKRTYKRRYKRRQGVKPVYLPITPPPRVLLKMRYSETLLATGITYSEVIYRTASVYDCQYLTTNMTVTSSVANGQPGWYDQISPWYRAYVVRGAKISFSVIGDGAEALSGQYIVSTASDGPVNYQHDWTSVGSKPSGSFLIGQTGGKNKSASFYVDNFRVQGLSNISSKLVQMSPIVASMNTSPTLSPFFQLMVTNADGSGTYKAIVKVNIVYYVEMFNRKLAEGFDV